LLGSQRQVVLRRLQLMRQPFEKGAYLVDLCLIDEGCNQPRNDVQSPG
jgi:hypothetical protein